jgi:hypothetical protein
MDFSEEKYDKNNGSNNNNMIIWKLLEFKILLDDFDLIKLDKYSKNLDKLNKNKNKAKLVFISNKNLSSILSSDMETGFIVEKKADGNNNFSNQNIRNSITNTNSNRSNYDYKKFNKNDLSNKNINLNMNAISNGSDLSKRLFDNKNKKNMNNSSHDILMDNSNFLKDKLNNNNSFNEYNDILDIAAINNNNNPNQIDSNANNNSYKGDPIKKHKDKNISKDVNELNENIQDIIINKSNNKTIFIIKIYLLIIVFIVFAIFAFSIYKIKITYSFKGSLNGYFTDFNILMTRYSLLYYYFNLLRTIIIFPPGERKQNMINIANVMRRDYEQENQ